MEPLAGLARLALAAGDLAEAQRYAETLYTFMLANQFGGAVLDPLWVYLTCFQVLQAAADARAQPLLARAVAQVQALLADQPPAVQASYQAIPSHAAILAAWEAANMPV